MMRLKSDKLFSYQFERSFRSLCKLYPEKAQSSVNKDKSKYFEELLIIREIIEDFPRKKTIRLLDIGSGAGNFSWLVRDLFCLEVTALDRMLEFDDKEKRLMGNSKDIVERLSVKGIKTVKADPLSDNYLQKKKYDIVVSFDVIEHIPSGLKFFLKKMLSKVSPGGYLVISTPNQVHLFNRIKALWGKNTWEDFDYYYTCENFFGHVREFTMKEFAFLFEKLGYRYSIFGSTHQLNKYGKLGSKYSLILSVAKKIIDAKFKSLSYSFFGVMKKSDE